MRDDSIFGNPQFDAETEQNWADADWQRRTAAPDDGGWHGLGAMPRVVRLAAILLWLQVAASVAANLLVPAESFGEGVWIWGIAGLLVLCTVNFHRRRSPARTILVVMLVIGVASSLLTLAFGIRDETIIGAQAATLVLGLVFGGALLWLLTRPECRAWCQPLR